jgi:hypothetical protein
MQPGLQLREQKQQSLATEVLLKAGRVRLAARGYSMLPTLWPGDRLTVQAQTLDEIRTGDIVLFVRGHRFFVHRVLRAPGMAGGFMTRGDAMSCEDGSLGDHELLGRVVSVSRGGEEVPPPACSWGRRLAGLALAYSACLRSVVLRARSWCGTRVRTGGR